MASDFHQMKTDGPRNSSCAAPRKTRSKATWARELQLEVRVRLRTVVKPDEDVTLLMSHLGLSLPSRSKTVQNGPKRSKTVQNVVEKNS